MPRRCGAPRQPAVMSILTSAPHLMTFSLYSITYFLGVMGLKRDGIEKVLTCSWSLREAQKLGYLVDPRRRRRRGQLEGHRFPGGPECPSRQRRPEFPPMIVTYVFKNFSRRYDVINSSIILTPSPDNPNMNQWNVNHGNVFALALPKKSASSRS